MYTLESSDVDTICFPSGVKDAYSWLFALRRPTERQKEKLELEMFKEADLNNSIVDDHSYGYYIADTK